MHRLCLLHLDKVRTCPVREAMEAMESAAREREMVGAYARLAVARTMPAGRRLAASTPCNNTTRTIEMRHETVGQYT